MRLLKFSTFLLLLISLSKSDFANCLSDSTITHFYTHIYDGDLTKSYETTTYHTDSGTVDNCTYSFLNGVWVFNGCIQNYYNDVIYQYDTNNRITDSTSRTGTINGWQYVTSHRYVYNLAGSLTLECILTYNGSSWDSSSVTKYLFDNSNNLTGSFSYHFNGGVRVNDSRFDYQFNAGQKTSRIYAHGNGLNWINDSMYVFVYLNGLRTGLDLSHWDANGLTWNFIGHYDYDSLTHLVQITKYDSAIWHGYPTLDTTLYIMDTLENVLFRSTFDAGNENYSSQSFSLINHRLINTSRAYAILWGYIDQNDNLLYLEADWSCSQRTNYQYDSLWRLIEIVDHSRCAMPWVTTTDYSYDSSGFMFQSIYVQESNFHDTFEQNTYYHSTSDSIDFIQPDWNINAFCPVTVFNPVFVLAGGCPPYSVQWSPSTGLSSDTVLNPEIILSDSILYTITYADQAGHSGTQQLTYNPFIVTMNVDSTCHGNSLARLTLQINANNYHIYWKKNGTFIPNSNFITYSVLQPGYYSAAIYNGDAGFGCTYYTDSVLINDNFITGNQTAYFCEGDNFTLPDSSIVDSAGTFTSTLLAASGCDSIVTTFLNQMQVDTVNYTDTISAGQAYTLPDGQTVFAAGIYNCTLNATSGCDSIIIVNLIDPVIDGIIVYDSDISITIFPSPVNSELNIEIKNPLQDVSVRIFDITGNLCSWKMLTGNSEVIQMSEFVPGSYIVALFIKDMLVSKRIIEKL